MTDLILLPTYNEKENVQRLVPQIFSLLPEISIMIIDDNSPDGTAAMVRQLAGRYPNLQLLARPAKAGLGRAYRAGLILAFSNPTIRSIVLMDADGSHELKALPDMLNCLADYDLIIGSRYIKKGKIINWPFRRRLISYLGNFYARFLTGLPIYDLTSGYLCFKKNILPLDKINKLEAAGFPFLMELKYLIVKDLGGRFLEWPITFTDRQLGQTKFSSQIFLEGLITPWRLFLKRIS